MPERTTGEEAGQEVRQIGPKSVLRVTFQSYPQLAVGEARSLRPAQSPATRLEEA